MRVLLVIVASLAVGCSTSSEAPVDLGIPFDQGRSDAGASSPDVGAAAPDVGPSNVDSGPPDLGCTTDEDRDGVRSVACGGDDCDDQDPSRYPGALERCDQRDQDCDPATLGEDLDRDGHIASACCNPQPSGSALCGDDCNDQSATVNPTAIESCNGVDDDCDSMTDEGRLTTFYTDMDGDSFGNMASPVMACAGRAGLTITPGDCADADITVYPGATERCNGRDDNCDGVSDEGCDCIDGRTRVCGAPLGMGFNTMGICRTGMQTCIAGQWGNDCVGSVLPRAEVCDALDNDCDGTPDNAASFMCRQGQSRACSNGCSVAGTQTCRADCTGWDVCRATEVCNACDDDGDTVPDNGFACVRGLVQSCTVPVCNTTGVRGCDLNCNLLNGGACRALLEVCNYCDDNGDGSFQDDRPLATTRLKTEYPSCSAAPVSGAAVCSSGPPTTVGSTMTLDTFVMLASTSMGIASGSATMLAPSTMGWGALEVRATIRVRRTSTPAPGPIYPDGGWSIRFGSSGFTFRWQFSSTPPGAPAADDYDIYGMTGRAGLGLGETFGNPRSPPTGAHFNTNSPLNQWVNQFVTFRYTPNDPLTPANEESLTASVNGANFVTLGPDTGASPRGLLGEHPPGSQLNVVVSATAGSRIGSDIELLLTTRTIVFGGGPTVITDTNQAYVERTNICP